jgi:hypothetical protein
MKYLLVALSVSLLTACTTVPVARTFPDAPAELKVSCPPLEKTPKEAKFSEVLTIVTKNYGRYHECSTQNEAWQRWYETQKKIFQEVK